MWRWRRKRFDDGRASYGPHAGRQLRAVRQHLRGDPEGGLREATAARRTSATAARARAGSTSGPTPPTRTCSRSPSTSSPNPRIQPGEPRRASCLQKLEAATRPGSVDDRREPDAERPATADRENELEAMRLWIEAGAPETGSVGDSTQRHRRTRSASCSTPACRPPDRSPSSRSSRPPPDDGVQFVMPTYLLPASDASSRSASRRTTTSRHVVPPRFQDPAAAIFYMNGSRLRQDPQSHHFVMTHSGLDAVVRARPVLRRLDLPRRRARRRGVRADRSRLVRRRALRERGQAQRRLHRLRAARRARSTSPRAGSPARRRRSSTSSRATACTARFRCAASSTGTRTPST